MSYQELKAEVDTLNPLDPPYGSHPADNFIRNMHLLLGHNKAAAYMDVDPNRDLPCLLCKHGF